MQEQQAKAIWNPDKDYWETPQADIFGHSVAYSEILPRSGMTQGGQLYERPTWAPHTIEHESLLLPTPQATDYKRNDYAADRERRSPSLTTVSYYFPTPRTTDMNGPARHGTGGMDLRTAVHELTCSESTRPPSPSGSE